MKNRLRHLTCILLSIILIFSAAFAQDNEEAGTDENAEKPVFFVESNYTADTEETGELVVSVYLRRMPGLIAGGSLGLRFAQDLGEYEFNCKFPYFEPFGTLEDNYHLFHFMENVDSEAESPELKGIDAQNEDVLLCTYTFNVTKSVADSVSKASVSLLQLDKAADMTGELASAVTDDIWAYDEEEMVWCYQGVLFAEDESDNYEDEKTFHIYLESNLPDAVGVNVSGKVSSYDPKKVATIELIDEETSETVKSIKISDDSGKGRTTQSFEFTEVTSGTYTLKITKPTHVLYEKHGIVVDGSDNIDALSNLDGEGGDTAFLPCGDIDGDGFIKFADRSLLLSSAYYGTEVAADDDIALLRDLDGDGFVKINDLNIMMASENYNKGAVIIKN